jgi:hypothetical protein
MYVRSIVSCFIALALAQNSYAQEATNLANHRFQLGIYDETAASAQEDYNRHRRELAEFKGARVCSFDKIDTYRCASSSNSYLPPFPVALPFELPPSDAGNTADFTWAPIGEVRNGRQSVTQWNSQADKGSLFNCADNLCSVIVHAVGSKSSTDTLAECRVTQANTVVGAPEDCRPVAIITSDETWIRVVAGYLWEEASIGLPDFDLQILHDPPLKIDNVLKVTQESLGGPPLGFETQLSRSSLIAVASYRLSPVLKGWRELITVRVDVDESYPPPPGVGLRLSTTLYVNRQNTDRPEDFHLPSEQQQHAYVEAIKAVLKAPLQSLCKKSIWKDSGTLSCS